MKTTGDDEGDNTSSRVPNETAESSVVRVEMLRGMLQTIRAIVVNVRPNNFADVGVYVCAEIFSFIHMDVCSMDSWTTGAGGLRIG